MGNAIANNSNVVNTNYAATLRGGLDVTGNISLTGSLSGFTDQSAPFGSTKTYTVTVASKDSTHRYNGQGSGNAYLIDGVQSPILYLTPGRTYRFTNDNTGSHPLKFYLEADKTTNYTTGVNFQNTYTEITVGDETPNVLHYQCTAHSLMCNAIVTNSNVVNSNYAATLRGGLSVTGGETTLSSATVSDLTSGRVVYAGGSGALQDSGNLVFNGTDLSASSLIVSDLTDGRVVLAGGSGAVEDNANLKFNTTTSEFEVVGHTVLDSINVSGLSTFTGAIDANGGATIDNIQIGITGDNEIDTSSGNLTIDSAGGTTTIDDILNVSGNATLSSDLNVTNNATIGGNLTVTGNVGIAGTLTYEDVSRVDAVGLSTFRDGLFIPDNQKAQFGNAAGSADLNIYHSGSHSFIDDTGTGNLKIRSNNLRISNGDESKIYATFTPTTVELYHDNSKKLETTVKGIQVGTGVTIETNGQATFAGIVTATKFIGDGSDLTGIDASALKFGGVVKAQANGFGVVVTGVTTSSGGFSGNLTGNVTGNADTATLATRATDLAINGTNQIVYQDSNNDSDVLPTGNAGQILASSGAGAAPQWVNSAPAGAIEGITIRDESSIVGTANSISTINFIGSVVTADAAVGAGIATVTVNAIAGLGVSEGSGSKATGATGLDFVGPLIGVDASSNTGISTVRVDALTIKDEGSTVGTAGSITTINFVGAGIAAAVSGDTATVTSAGGVTNADVVALAIALG